jgi:hypothetical protein
MGLKAFKVISTDSDDLDRVQGNIDDAISPVIASAVVGGNLITGISMTAATDKVINHGLGRALQGWTLVGVSADTRVFDKQATNSNPKSTLILQSVNTATISIWVF